jgi:hypothetical protein
MARPVNLPNHEIYIKLMIDGTPSEPFSATTLPHSLIDRIRPRAQH